MAENDAIRALMLSGLDQAFQAQIGNLYRTWLTNPSDLETQRARTAQGTKNAIEIYRMAHEVIMDWEKMKNR